jgi:hypothetical protein
VVVDIRGAGQVPDRDPHARGGPAGVTDRLWETVDVVDVLDAFEAKQKRTSRPIFEGVKWALGESFYVRVTLPDGTIERIEGFATEGEAGRWIKNESVVWLRQKNEAVSTDAH